MLEPARNERSWLAGGWRLAAVPAAAWLMLAAAPVAAQELKAGDRAAVIRSGAAVVSGPEVVDSLDRGEIVTVAAGNAEWVMVRRAHAGWISRKDLIPAGQGLEFFSKLIQRNPRNAGAWVARAVLHIDGKRFDAARTDAAEALRLDPQLVSAWLARAAAARGQQKWAEALEFAEQAVQIDSSQPRAYVAAGDALREQGQLHRAAFYYGEALLRDPGNAPVHLRRGQALMAARQSQPQLAALVDLDAAVEFAAYDSVVQREAKLARGEALLNLGRLDDAEKCFAELLVRNPYDIRALIGRGTAYGRLRTYVLAVPDLDMAVWLNPQSTLGYLGRAEFRLQVGKLDQALKDVADALQLDPRCVAAYRIRGEALVKQQKWDDARTAFDQALAITPGDANLYRARALAHDGNIDAKAAASDRQLATELELAASESWAGIEPTAIVTPAALPGTSATRPATGELK